MKYPEERIRLIELTLNKLSEKIYTKIAPLSVTAYRTKEPVPFSDKTSGEKLTLSIGDAWGELFDCAWFYFEGEIPQNISGKKVLMIDVSGELLTVDKNGNPAQGLTNKWSGFDRKQGKPGKYIVELDERDKNVVLWADGGLNDLFGNIQNNGKIIDADIAVYREDLKNLYYDFMVLYDLTDELPEDSARKHKILEALTNASALLLNYTEEETAAASKILSVPLSKKNGDVDFKVTAIGHAHIDLAWLWPIRETFRKGARTFATALMNMEKYPDYIFGASQPQLFMWMKIHYPSLYERVKQRVKDGRIEVQGCMWVEADTNVSGGEALARQVLYGKRFFREEFGIDVKSLWLPDVFGYSGALPQILKKSGVDYLLTQKLSWSRYNKPPYSTFMWRGIDGSAVLTHFPPEDTYNSPALPHSFTKTERQFKEKAVADEAMVLFGIGDGGGGPGEEHLESLKRLKNLSGLPPVTQEHSSKFFERQDKFAKKLPSWTGELYLEFHQGTYTTQARNKKYNRLSELALRELELHSALGAVFGGGWSYPKEQLDELWKEVLLYQFHDILPGSSITRVYTESLERYRLINERIAELDADALNRLKNDSQYSVINNLSWQVEGWSKIGEKWAYVKAPSLGISNDVDFFKPSEPLTAEPLKLGNAILSVIFNEDGTVASVYDKTNDRETLLGGGNILKIYRDTGDAWDFHKYYQLLAPEILVRESAKAYIDGPKAVLEQIYKYNGSTIIQRVSLTSGSGRLDFETEVDWQETEKMLRADFDLDVFAQDVVCDIQFGTIKRPAMKNTSWDTAKFEICAQKWVDLSQTDYGAAVMSDCKYGYAVDENHISLNLLRSPTYPDPVADKGKHSFKYAFYPHKGNHIEGNVIKTAYELIDPPKAVAVGLNPCGLLSVDSPNVIVEAVKKAEDDDSLIIRLYECAGGGVKTDINLGFDAKAAYSTDIMEENPTPININNKAISLKFTPFEIKTIKLDLLGNSR